MVTNSQQCYKTSRSIVEAMFCINFLTDVTNVSEYNCGQQWNKWLIYLISDVIPSITTEWYRRCDDSSDVLCVQTSHNIAVQNNKVRIKYVIF